MRWAIAFLLGTALLAGCSGTEAPELEFSLAGGCGWPIPGGAGFYVDGNLTNAGTALDDPVPDLVTFLAEDGSDARLMAGGSPDSIPLGASEVFFVVFASGNLTHYRVGDGEPVPFGPVTTASRDCHWQGHYATPPYGNEPPV